MDIKKEDFKLFKTYEGRQFYALPKKFFNEIITEPDPIPVKVPIPPVEDTAELIEVIEAEKLMTEKIARQKAAEEIKLVHELAAKEKAEKKAALLKELEELGE